MQNAENKRREFVVEGDKDSARLDGETLGERYRGRGGKISRGKMDRLDETISKRGRGM